MSDRDVRKLAKIVADHSRQIKGLSGGPQAAYSSIEGGSIDAYDNDGKMRLRIGAQDDGTHSVKYVQGPPPPRPTAPVVSVDGPVVRVRWDGMLMGGHIPEDFSRIDVHFALASEDIEDASAVRGNLATSAGNETVLAATQTGTYRVGLVAMSQSRARSDMSEVVDVDVTLVDIEGALDAVVDNASGGQNHYSPEPPAGTDHDPDRDLWFDTSVDADGLVSYSPHRWDVDLQGWISLEDERVQAIQDAQNEFEGRVEQELSDVEFAASRAQHAADDALAAINAGDALWEDPGFEIGYGPIGDAHPDINRSTVHAYQGAWSMEYTTNGDGALIYPGLTAASVTPGRVYRLSAAVRSDDGLAFQSWVQQRAADDSLIKAENHFNVPGGVGSWALGSEIYEIAEGTATLRLSPLVPASGNGTAGQKLYLDNFTLTDITDGYAQYRAAMEAAQEAQQVAGEAKAIAEAAVGAAEGGNTNFFSTSPPAGVGSLVGDRWFQRDTGNAIIGMWLWDGDNWVRQTLNNEVIGNLDAGKITTGYLEGARIKAGSITADRLVVGVSQNLLVDSLFKNADINAARATAVWQPVEHGVETHFEASGSVLNASLYLTTDGSPNTPETRLAVDSSISWSVQVDVKVGPGAAPIDRMFFSFVGFRADGSGRFSTALLQKPGGGTQVTSADGWVRMVAEYDWSAVGDVVMVAPRLLVTQGGVGGGAYSVRNPFVGEQSGATLIKDGAITTDKMAVGSITAASGIIGSLDLGVAIVGKLHGQYVEAGSIDTEQLAFGAATGDVLSVDALNFKTAVGLDIRGSSFRAGDAVEMTEDFGIRQFGPDGALNVSLPSDGSPAEFRGDLSARTLTATGRMSIQGPGAVASGGVLELESGVVPPVAGPQIGNEWERTTMPPLLDAEQASGIAWMEEHWWRAVTTTLAYDAGGRGRIEKITAAGGLVSSFEVDFRTRINGVTAHDGLLYVLGAASSGAIDNRTVIAYSTNGTESHRWEYTAYGTGTYQPGIGSHGSNIVIAQCWASGALSWRIYRPSDGHQISQVDREGNVGADIVGIQLGQFDLDAQKILVGASRASSSRVQMLAYSHSGTPEFESGYSWYAADYAAIRGFAWDGSRFWTLQPDGHLAAYQPLEAGRFVGDNDSDWWGAVMWATTITGEPNEDGWSSGTDYQTPAGPSSNFRYLFRSRLRFSSGDVPEGVGRAVFCFAKDPLNDPVSRWDLRAVMVSNSPEQNAIISSLPENWKTNYGNPPATNSFPTDAPGEIHSAIGQFRVDGTGAGSWGPLEFHADGTMSGLPVTSSGTVSITPSAPPATETVTVTLPAGRYSAAPTVVATPVSTALHQVEGVGVWNVTASSFQIGLRRTNGTTTEVAWIATGG